MHAERDYLNRIVLPELARQLRLSRHRLEPVDLRWGIDTTTIEGDEGRQALVLRYCLVSVEKCKPCMIVLMGDRDGWVPDAVRLVGSWSCSARSIPSPISPSGDASP